MTAWGSVAELLGDDLDDIEFVGRGSSGSVYRATQRSLGRTVAVKVFRRFADDEADRVLSEARAQAELSWHGNVVSLYDQGTTPDGFPYLVMEYAPGGSLQDRVRDRGPLTAQAWRSVGAELSAALAAAHEAGVVHCDVKPSNVLFAADGSVRLADFGIAKAAGMTSGTLDSIEGSLGYAAPELLDGERPRAANDVYSLALTLGYAQTGQPPLDEALTLAQAVAAVNAGVPVAEMRWQACPDAVEAVLHRACSPKPGLRPSASELAEVLSSEVPVGAEPYANKSAGRAGRYFGVGAAVVIMALVGALLVRSPQRGVEPVAAAPAFDLCAEYESYVEARTEVFDGASSSLEQSTSPVDAANQLLRSYPDQFGVVAAAYIQKVLDNSELTGEVTADQLATMAMADNLRVLGGGKPFLFDGTSGAFDPSVLPVYLAQPSQMFSEVNRYSSERCPEVSDDFAPARARLSSAIFSNLSDPVFMKKFFEDPRSLDVFDSRTTILLATYAWEFFEGVLLTEPAWFMSTLERHDDIRRTLAFEQPATLLKVAASDPSALEQLRQPEWLADLQVGIDRSLPMERLGMSESFDTELRALALEVK